MNDHFRQIVLDATGASELCEKEKIQDLWSGYGVIKRYELKGSEKRTVVVKHVHFPNETSHPRGWNTDLSHERKLKSYEVETAWYSKWSCYCDESCHVPECLAFESHKDEVLIVLEDLNSTGYEIRKHSVSIDEMKVCLSWLANFHATYLGKKPDDLWHTGTYWHLDTRPDELEVLDDRALKQAASKIDKILEDSPFQTFVHGDAKLANFCFSPNGEKVAAVDFQYVGGGCGMKDVAYFFGSCMYDDECEKREKELLNYYFNCFSTAVETRNISIELKALEENWRLLYPVAWTDFHRFIKGWSPGHWKINSYSERLQREVLDSL